MDLVGPSRSITLVMYFFTMVFKTSILLIFYQHNTYSTLRTEQ